MKPSGSPEFNHAVDEYFEQVYFQFAADRRHARRPHQYDTQLEDYSRQTIQQQICDLHFLPKRFLQIPRPTDLVAAATMTWSWPTSVHSC